MKRTSVAVLALVVLLTASLPLVAQTPGKAWSEKWKAENKRWIVFHLNDLEPDRLDGAKRLIAEGLAPLGFNVLILEVDYRFQFKSHPELEAKGLDKEQARELVEVCRKHGIRLIPLMNCLGHQSWGAKPGVLLAKYPQFDETPSISQDDKKIYCREWCPSHPDVNKIVFDLIDELIDAFDADAFHVGMDEVFLIGDKNCPRCKGKDVGELFAKVVNELHDHLVEHKGVKMLMWSDRLLDSEKTGYGKWEASATGSHKAIDRVPKDIILCDWHYELPAAYQKMGQKSPFPSVQFFQEKGFRVLPAPWRNPESATAFLRVAKQSATDKMLGVLFTSWGAGTNPERVLAGLKSEPKPFRLGKEPSPEETIQGIAATIQAGLKELRAPAEWRFSDSGIPGIPRAHINLAAGTTVLAQPQPTVPEGVTIERDIEYGKAGDVSLKLDMLLPKQPAKAPLPLLVYIHGGGWNGHDKTEGYEPLGPLVASGNYVGATVEYRFTSVAPWPAQIYDCKAAIRWLRANAKKYNVDPDRIGIWGVSAGGHLVSMLGTTGDRKELEGQSGTPGQSTRVACVVDACGPADLPNMKPQEQKVYAMMDRLLGGPMAERMEAARAASPITYVDENTPPFLIVHGNLDTQVPYSQSETFYAALNAAGVYATLVRIEAGKHQPFYAEAAPQVEAFFEQRLRGHAVNIPHPLSVPESVSLERDIEYAKAGKTSLRLDMVRPKEPPEKLLPLVVYIHGGGWYAGDKSQEGLSSVVPLAASGNYVGVSVNYRFSQEAIWPAQIYDCKAAIRWLRANAQKYGIDPNRIGVWGTSAGGHLASMLGTTADVKELEGDEGSLGQSTRVSCVVDGCGPTDLQTFAVGQRLVTQLLGGTADEKPEAARSASPLAFVNKDCPPFLILHGTEDRAVPFEQATTFYEALKAAGVDATLIKIEGRGHDGPFRREYQTVVRAFFGKHLRGQE